MSWKLLHGRGGADGAELSYSVQRTGKRNRMQVQFSLSGDLIRRCGWVEGQRLQLLVGKGDHAGHGMLRSHEVDGRKLAVIGVTGRGHCKFTWTEEVAADFDERDSVYALDVTAADEHGLVFIMPGCEPAEGEEDA